MVGPFGSILERVREAWAVEEPDERIVGSGDAHLDPAYNSRYTAERRLRDLAAADEEAGPDDPRTSDGGLD